MMPDLPDTASKQAYAVLFAIKYGISPSIVRDLVKVSDPTATGEDIANALAAYARSLPKDETLPAETTDIKVKDKDKDK